jgi:hypothetical protein
MPRRGPHVVAAWSSARHGDFFAFQGPVLLLEPLAGPRHGVERDLRVRLCYILDLLFGMDRLVAGGSIDRYPAVTGGPATRVAGK